MSNYSSLNAKIQLDLNSLKSSINTLKLQYDVAKRKMEELLSEQDLIERTRVALDQARPLLSANSIKQLETLANTAVSSIFGLNSTITYDIESRRFVLSDGTNVCDLADSNGGGLVTVISFVFDLFLLVKQGCRRLLVYDEAFYAVSDVYYDEFIRFVNRACKDLGVDLLLVSHDVRLDPSMVDTVYRIENGKSIKVK